MPHIALLCQEFKKEKEHNDLKNTYASLNIQRDVGKVHYFVESFMFCAATRNIKLVRQTTMLENALE